MIFKNKFNSKLDDIKCQFLRESNTKIVVMGHQKSGTTAIAALLATHTNLTYFSDPIFKTDRSSSRTLDNFINHENLFLKTVKSNTSLYYKNIVKDPDFIFNLPLVKLLYPKSKFIFIARDPRQVIRSIFNRLKLDGTTKKKSVHIDDLYKGTKNWVYLLNGDDTNDGHTIVSRLAVRIEMASKIYLENHHNFTLVRYETFKVNKSEYINRLATDLGLQSKIDIDSIVDKQYQPAGSQKACISQFFGDSNLSAIESLCTVTLKSFNYI